MFAQPVKHLKRRSIRRRNQTVYLQEKEKTVADVW